MHLKRQFVKKLSFVYLGFVLFLHVVPLGDDLDLRVNNSYVLDTLRLDHLLHCILLMPTYFFLSALVPKFCFRARLSVLLLSIAFAALAESFQILIPYRAFTLPDLIANTSGVVVGCIVFETSRILNIVKP